MPTDITQYKPILDILVQIILVVAPVLITWFVRSYVRQSNYEKQIGSIVRLSNVAINYVENLEKRGDLAVPEGVSHGAEKLRLASEWLEGELKKNGISVNDEEAAKWISSEFQNRVGGVMTSSITPELASTAVDLVAGLEKGDLSTALTPERMDFLTGLATDWLMTQLATERGVRIPREEAQVRVRAEMLNRLQGVKPPQAAAAQSGDGDTVNDLARRALDFLDGLKTNSRTPLNVRFDRPGENIDRDLAVAWMLTEAARTGISISPDEFARAISNAFRERADRVSREGVEAAPLRNGNKGH